jgi:very-short-patch-repair endonuclease
MKVKNEASDLLRIHLAELGLEFRTEVRFYAARQWRADFEIIEHGILLEIEGGVWSGGRHLRGAGFIEDCEKYNTATMLGFRVLRFETQSVLNGDAKKFLKEWLGAKRRPLVMAEREGGAQ